MCSEAGAEATPGAMTQATGGQEEAGEGAAFYHVNFSVQLVFSNQGIFRVGSGRRRGGRGGM